MTNPLLPDLFGTFRPCNHADLVSSYLQGDATPKLPSLLRKLAFDKDPGLVTATLASVEQIASLMPTHDLDQLALLAQRFAWLTCTENSAMADEKLNAAFWRSMRVARGDAEIGSLLCSRACIADCLMVLTEEARGALAACCRMACLPVDDMEQVAQRLRFVSLRLGIEQARWIFDQLCSGHAMLERIVAMAAQDGRQDDFNAVADLLGMTPSACQDAMTRVLADLMDTGCAEATAASVDRVVRVCVAVSKLGDVVNEALTAALSRALTPHAATLCACQGSGRLAILAALDHDDACNAVKTWLADRARLTEGNEGQVAGMIALRVARGSALSQRCTEVISANRFADALHTTQFSFCDQTPLLFPPSFHVKALSRYAWRDVINASSLGSVDVLSDDPMYVPLRCASEFYETVYAGQRVNWDDAASTVRLLINGGSVTMNLRQYALLRRLTKGPMEDLTEGDAKAMQALEWCGLIKVGAHTAELDAAFSGDDLDISHWEPPPPQAASPTCRHTYRPEVLRCRIVRLLKRERRTTVEHIRDAVGQGVAPEALGEAITWLETQDYLTREGEHLVYVT